MILWGHGGPNRYCGDTSPRARSLICGDTGAPSRYCGDTRLPSVQLDFGDTGARACILILWGHGDPEHSACFWGHGGPSTHLNIVGTRATRSRSLFWDMGAPSTHLDFVGTRGPRADIVGTRGPRARSLILWGHRGASRYRGDTGFPSVQLDFGDTGARACIF